jgi:hypothetical protein
VLFALAALLLALPASSAEEATPALVPREQWSDVFGDTPIELHFTVKGARAWQGRAVWRFTTINDRVLANGETDVGATPNRSGTVTIKLRSPEVKPGVVLKTRLQVSLLGPDDRKPAATHERTIWVFPGDPFALRATWLKGLKIALFDPEKTTAESLRKLKVPFEEIDNVAALGAVKEGHLLVGEGVSFKDYPDLAETLLRAAAAGRPVLCLAPAAGTLPVPGADSRLPQPRALSWRRSDHITTLDHRLDATAWPPEGKVVASTLALKAEDGAVVAEVGRGADDWPWLEAEFPARKGRLIVSGFGLFGKAWDAGPAPRYLFARMLEVLTDKPESRDSQDKETNR